MAKGANTLYEARLLQRWRSYVSRDQTELVPVRACSMRAIDVGQWRCARHLSGSHHQDRGAVRSGRRHRRGGAHAGAGDGKGSRRLRHHREQAGRGHYHRHAGGRDQRGRWLHAADGHLRQCGQSGPLRQATVRPAPRSRLRRAGGALLQPGRGQSEIADQLDQGSDRGREGRAGQIILRHLWHRHVGASRRRIVQAHGGRQPDHGARTRARRPRSPT